MIKNDNKIKNDFKEKILTQTIFQKIIRSNSIFIFFAKKGWLGIKKMKILTFKMGFRIKNFYKIFIMITKIKKLKQKTSLMICLNLFFMMLLIMKKNITIS